MFLSFIWFVKNDVRHANHESLVPNQAVPGFH